MLRNNIIVIDVDTVDDALADALCETDIPFRATLDGRYTLTFPTTEDAVEFRLRYL